MPNGIRIKRSASTNVPASLTQGEVAFSEAGSPNGLGELFIGTTGAVVTKITTSSTAGVDGTAAQPNSSAQNNQTITTGVGISGADAGSAGNITLDLDYAGVDNFIDVATNLEGTAIDVLDSIIYHDATDNNIKKGLVSDLPFGLGTGDISRVNITAGVGLSGTVDTLTGDHTQTLALDFSELTDMTANITGATEFILQDGTTESRKTANEIQLSFFNNNSGWQANDANTVLTTAVLGAWNWVKDEDNMVSNSALHLPTQQSVKAYVDAAIVGGMTHRGGYNASTNTPALDTGSPVLVQGDMYTVTVAGTFFTVALEIGDVLIADVTSSDAALVTDWTIVQRNLGAAAESTPGYIQLATQAQMNTATDDLTAVTPLKFASSTIDGGTF